MYIILFLFVAYSNCIEFNNYREGAIIYPQNIASSQFLEHPNTEKTSPLPMIYSETQIGGKSVYCGEKRQCTLALIGNIYPKTS